ncbi:MAG: SdrD B-like domain-containing protein [Bacteroidota bacterium]
MLLGINFWSINPALGQCSAPSTNNSIFATIGAGLEAAQSFQVNGTCQSGNVFTSFKFWHKNNSSSVTATLKIYDGESVNPGDLVYTQTNIPVNDASIGSTTINLSGGTGALSYVVGQTYTVSLTFSGNIVWKPATVHVSPGKLKFPNQNFFRTDADYSFEVGTGGSTPTGTATINTTVWDDQNANKALNNNEPRIENVDVELLDGSNGNVIATEQTNVSGVATFNNVPAGTFKLRYILPTDHDFTPKASGNITDDGKSDANASGVTGNFTVAAGATVNYVDAGMWAPGTVTTTVWDDQNANKAQNNNEPRIGGVTVTMYEQDGTTVVDDANGSPITDVTDANGNVTLYMPADRSVLLVYTILPDHKFTPKASGNITDDGKSDANASGVTGTFRVNRGSQQINYVDAGMWAPGTVTTTVWDDQNANKAQNNNEPRISGVTVELIDVNNNDNVLDTDVTDGNGQATLIGIPADRPVRLRYTILDDHKFTPKANGNISDDGKSDANSQGETGTFSVDRGSQQINYVDAGMWAPGTVTTTVWNDQNANKAQNNNEPKVAGIKVELLDINNADAVLGMGVTNASGQVTFTKLVPADRPVRLRYTLLPDHKFTPKASGNISDDGKSDANSAGLTGSFSVDRGSQQINYIDAGVWAPGQVKAQVWEDTNGNRAKNNNEDGLYGFEVKLLETDNSPVLFPTSHPKAGQEVKAFTQCGGGIATLYLPADRSVKLKFEPNGSTFTPKASGNITNDGKSDANASGFTGTFSASKGSHMIQYVDAGIATVNAQLADASVTTFVWDDRNADKNFQGEGSHGIQGVKVRLTDVAGNTCTCATTGADGKATLPVQSGFANKFRLKYDRPADHRFTGKTGGITGAKNSDAPSSGITDKFSISSGENITYINAGLWAPGTLTTLVWDDRNADKNFQGEGSHGVENVSVHLTEVDGTVLATETTGSDGKATFTNVPADRQLRLKYDRPADHRFTGKTGGITGAKNSDAPSSGVTDKFQASRGSDNITYVNAGLWVPGTLTTLVWDDRNADKNFQGEGTHGVNMVEVHLTEVDGTVLATEKTGPDGKATFGYVPADRQLRLKYVRPDDHRFTGKTGGITGAKNSDAPSSGETDKFQASRGSDNITYVNAGLWVPGTLTTFVWDDRNADKNFQGEGSHGVENVSVHLTEVNGDVLDTKTTGMDGKATFDYVPADRQLRLKYDLPVDHRFTGKTGGITGAKNSDAPSSGETDKFQATRGSENITYVNAGLWVPGTLKAFVWEDANNDGSSQGEGGRGVGGVTVSLTEVSGKPVLYPTGHPRQDQEVRGVTGCADGIAHLDYVPADRQFRLLVEGNGIAFTNKSGSITATKNSDVNSSGVTDKFQVNRGSQLIEYVDAGLTNTGFYNTLVTIPACVNDRDLTWIDQDANAPGIQVGTEVVMSANRRNLQVYADECSSNGQQGFLGEFNVICRGQCAGWLEFKINDVTPVGGGIHVTLEVTYNRWTGYTGSRADKQQFEADYPEGTIIVVSLEFYDPNGMAIPVNGCPKNNLPDLRDMYVISKTLPNGGGNTRLANPTEVGLQVYPNPTSTIVNIVTKEDILIFNASGQTTYQGAAGQIDVSTWAKGVYLIKAGAETKRFIVQ